MPCAKVEMPLQVYEYGKRCTPRDSAMEMMTMDSVLNRSTQPSPGTGCAISPLYDRALPARRTGALFTAFPYPTKISPEAIALFIASHTRPGDTVFDGFAGSGSTGVAAMLCEKPSPELRAQARRLGLNVEWGARNAVLYELGALGAFIGRVLTNPPDPKVFSQAANEILEEAEKNDGWMYAARDAEGKQGVIRHVIWADELRCPRCGTEATVWETSVSLDPPRIGRQFRCPYCKYGTTVDEVERITQKVWDDVLQEERELRRRRIVWVYGSTGKRYWSRPATPEDLALVERIQAEPVPASAPRMAIQWGDLHRSGYHQGITHVHHFYTRRNLIVFAHLWEMTDRYHGKLRDALRFWLLSYNASHATLMTRIVAKGGQKDFVVTSSQPGVLYISGLPVEKNLHLGLRRKLSTIVAAFKAIHGLKGRVEVRQQSSCTVHLPDGSIDYIFTDPPFGGNIPYAEVNFINEAWLGKFTDRSEEVIVSASQNKTVAEYRNLLSAAFCEAYRILKSDGKATVVFHSSKADIWNALLHALNAAGFGIERTGVLDRVQATFKDVATTGSVRGDSVLLLNKKKRGNPTTRVRQNVWRIAEQLCISAREGDGPRKQTAERLYSRLVAYYLSHNERVPIDEDEFINWWKKETMR